MSTFDDDGFVRPGKRSIFTRPNKGECADPALPPLCYAENPSDGRTIVVRRGEAGYNESRYQGDPSVLNCRIGVSDKQAAAMLAGSMFGWDVPAARAP